MIALGDSHIKMFSGLINNIVSVPGATSLGLTHLNSKTGARETFIKALKNSHEIQLFCLGEVDCNALIWRRKQPIRPFIKKSTNHYLEFILTFTSFPAICSVPLPAVESYQKPPYSDRKISNRGNVKAGKLLRTFVVKLFNQRLERLCKKHFLYFIDLTKHTANDHGTLNMYYAKNSADSHLNHLRLQSILKDEIDKAKAFYHYI